MKVLYFCLGCTLISETQFQWLMNPEEYKREIEHIFNLFPSFQRVGGRAYKPGIETMLSLSGVLGNPHRKFKSVHIAGTNGKGSTSHLIAAALTATKDMKIALYTSPHLIDFRERMKISLPDGRFEMPDKEFVYDFLTSHKEAFTRLNASFFEITTAMAFYWFAQEKADIAIVECGLGGRLDATNIITPVISIITNIGLDHCEYLGNTVEEIAREKAGIMKKGVPTVIGEKSGVAHIFQGIAAERAVPLYFAEDMQTDIKIEPEMLDLKGFCQRKNVRGVECALQLLFDSGEIPSGKGFLERLYRASELTGLRGRWEKLSDKPYVVCDTGHNAHGFSILGEQILQNAAGTNAATGMPFKRLILFFGVVADKDLDSIVRYLPRKWKNRDGIEGQAIYYFVQVAGTRALPVGQLHQKMGESGIHGTVLPCKSGSAASGGNVCSSLDYYFQYLAAGSDFVFIGGSTYVVAEALEFFQTKR